MNAFPLLVYTFSKFLCDEYELQYTKSGAMKLLSVLGSRLYFITCSLDSNLELCSTYP